MWPEGRSYAWPVTSTIRAARASRCCTRGRAATAKSSRDRPDRRRRVKPEVEEHLERAQHGDVRRSVDLRPVRDVECDVVEPSRREQLRMAPCDRRSAWAIRERVVGGSLRAQTVESELCWLRVEDVRRCERPVCSRVHVVERGCGIRTDDRLGRVLWEPPRLDLGHGCRSFAVPELIQDACRARRARGDRNMEPMEWVKFAECEYVTGNGRYKCEYVVGTDGTWDNGREHARNLDSRSPRAT
eukprot:681794-Prymnesium_polylepis.4